MILAREILSGDRLGSTLLSRHYLFGILVVSVAWIGTEVWVRDHLGGGWTFAPDALVRCLCRWDGTVPG